MHITTATGAVPDQCSNLAMPASTCRWFVLTQLPDLEMARYGAEAESTVAGVVETFNQALKPLHRLGLSYGLRVHLLFGWHPEAVRGQRLHIALGFTGALEQMQSAPLQPLLSSLPFQPYFGRFLREVDAPSDLVFWQGQSWSSACCGVQVAKRERFAEPLSLQVTEEVAQSNVDASPAPVRLHGVDAWQARSDSRLISLLKLMQALDTVALFSLTLEPTEKSDELARLYEHSLHRLRDYQSNRFTRGLLTDSYKQLPPDPQGDKALKQREDLLERLADGPHFQAAIACWAPQAHLARLLAETAVAEALEEGAHTIHPLSSDRAAHAFSILQSGTVLPTPCATNTPAPLVFVPHLFTQDEIQGFFCLPVLYEGEQLDLAKETDAALALRESELKGEVAVPLGLRLGVAGETTDQLLAIPLQNLTKHALVAGVPGSGKTNTLMFMAWHLWREHKVPFLILEPAKREYRGLKNIDDANELAIYTPGRPHPGVRRDCDWLQFQFNPFQFPQGVPLAEHATNLLACFEGAFPLFAPLPAMVERAIGRVYAELSWSIEDVCNGQRAFPLMECFVEVLRKEVEATEYSSELAGTLKAALDMRFSRLTSGLVGQVFNTPVSTLAPEDWLKVPVVIELESLGSGYANFLTLLILTQIREVLSVKPNKTLQHLLVLEEAHNLIGPDSVQKGGADADPLTAATAYIVKLLAEVRALGQGIVIADQLPSKLAPEVLKNTSLKICQRLTAPDDRGQMGQTMQASAAQLERVATLMPGQALVSFEGLLKPFFAAISPADENYRHLNNLPTDAQLLGNYSEVSI